jgi:hypothetical protein
VEMLEVLQGIMQPYQGELVSLPREVQQEVLLFSFGIQYFRFLCVMHTACWVLCTLPIPLHLSIEDCLPVGVVDLRGGSKTNTQKAPTKTSILGTSFLEGGESE